MIDVAKAFAVDDNGLDVPQCQGTWTQIKQGEFQNQLGDFSNGVPTYAGVGTYYQCGVLVKFEGEPNDVGASTFIAEKTEDGLRGWFKKATGDSGNLVTQRPWSDAEVFPAYNLSDKGIGVKFLIKRSDIAKSEAYAMAGLNNVTSVEFTNPSGLLWHLKDREQYFSFQLAYLGSQPTTDTTLPNEFIPLLDGNGGAWGGVTLRTPKMSDIKSLSDWTSKNIPTRPGYTFKNWATDQNGDHPVDDTTVVQTGQRLYAQWEKTAGDPQKVDLDCSTGGRCELTVNYTGSTALTREFLPGSGSLAWPGAPISGVRLDSNGFAADGACSDTRCWYVSLEKEPQSQSGYQAQMPTTGAPEGLSSIGLFASVIAVLGLTPVLLFRKRV